jgi:ubiquinone biosynthesis protein
VKTGFDRWRRNERRDEVASRLAALATGRPYPRAVTRRPGDPAAALASVLGELGPVFAAFGRYLSSRVDLLPEPACRALAATPGRHPPLAHCEVGALVASALGRPVEALFAELEPEPVVFGPVVQEHRARANGAPLRLRLTRPELAAALERDLPLLGLLGPALAALGMDPAWIGGAAEDFAAILAIASDPAAQAAARGQETASPGAALGLSPLVAELSAAGVLTFEEPPGVPFDSLAPEAAAAAAGTARAEELAARLCQAWLRRALGGRAFPVELRLDRLWALADGRIAWLGSELATLPPASCENLWSYLDAAAADDPDRACAALLRELHGGGEDGGVALSQRLRQLVPFRDGGLGARDDLAGYLVLHWRCATQAGYEAGPHLVGFYRGLYRLAAVARRLAPGRDALREGFEAARLAVGIGDVTRLLDVEQLQQIAGGYAQALLAVPQRLNELIGLLADGRANVRIELVEPRGAHRHRDRRTASVAALLVLAAVGLLARDLLAASGLAPSPELVAAGLLGVAGGLLLRGPGRKR